MENKTNKAAATNAAIIKQEVINFTAKVAFNQNQNGDNNIITIMDNPFKDVKLKELRLSFANADKKNSFGQIQEDRYGKKTKGLWDFYATQELEDSKKDFITIAGTIEYLQTKIKKEFVKYINIAVENPFPFYEIDEKRKTKMLKIYLQNAEMVGLFDDLAKKRLVLKTVI